MIDMVSIANLSTTIITFAMLGFVLACYVICRVISFCGSLARATPIFDGPSPIRAYGISNAIGFLLLTEAFLVCLMPFANIPRATLPALRAKSIRPFLTWWKELQCGGFVRLAFGAKFLPFNSRTAAANAPGARPLVNAIPIGLGVRLPEFFVCCVILARVLIALLFFGVMGRATPLIEFLFVRPIILATILNETISVCVTILAAVFRGARFTPPPEAVFLSLVTKEKFSSGGLPLFALTTLFELGRVWGMIRVHQNCLSGVTPWDGSSRRQGTFVRFSPVIIPQGVNFA